LRRCVVASFDATSPTTTAASTTVGSSTTASGSALFRNSVNALAGALSIPSAATAGPSTFRTSAGTTTAWTGNEASCGIVGNST